MDLTVKRGKRGFYIGNSEDDFKAEITYSPTEDESVIIADHTFVSEELRGLGIAGKLFQRLIEFAREEDLKIIPKCSYIVNKMEESDDYQDVLAT